MNGKPKSAWAMCRSVTYCTHPEIDGVDKAILNCLAQNVSDHETYGGSRPGNENLMNACVLKWSATHARLAKLVKLGLIVCTEVGDGRANTGSIWRICLDHPAYPDYAPNYNGVSGERFTLEYTETTEKETETLRPSRIDSENHPAKPSGSYRTPNRMTSFSSQPLNSPAGLPLPEALAVSGRGSGGAASGQAGAAAPREKKQNLTPVVVVSAAPNSQPVSVPANVHTLGAAPQTPPPAKPKRPKMVPYWIHKIWKEKWDTPLRVNSANDKDALNLAAMADRTQSMFDLTGEETDLLIAVAWATFVFDGYNEEAPTAGLYCLQPMRYEKHVKRGKDGKEFDIPIENHSAVTKFPLATFLAAPQGCVLSAIEKLRELRQAGPDARKKHLRRENGTAYDEAIETVEKVMGGMINPEAIPLYEIETA